MNQYFIVHLNKKKVPPVNSTVIFTLSRLTKTLYVCLSKFKATMYLYSRRSVYRSKIYLKKQILIMWSTRSLLYFSNRYCDVQCRIQCLTVLYVHLLYWTKLRFCLDYSSFPSFNMFDNKLYSSSHRQANKVWLLFTVSDILT